MKQTVLKMNAQKKRIKTKPASTVYRSHKFRGKRHTMLAEGRPQSPEFEQRKMQRKIHSTERGLT